jgi:hypothetical protein
MNFFCRIAKTLREIFEDKERELKKDIEKAKKKADEEQGATEDRSFWLPREERDLKRSEMKKRKRIGKQ